MSPRTPKQFEEIREEKKKLIMQEALELFANEGYHSASISKIAKQAGISKGLMYNYFASKEDLLKAIVVEAMTEIYKSFDRNHDGELTGEEFEYFLRETFKAQKKKQKFYKLYYSLLVQPQIQELINIEVHNLVQQVLTITYNYFQKYFDDPETEMILYSSIIKGLSMQYIYSRDYLTDEKLEKTLNRIIELYKR